MQSSKSRYRDHRQQSESLEQFPTPTPAAKLLHRCLMRILAVTLYNSGSKLSKKRLQRSRVYERMLRDLNSNCVVCTINNRNSQTCRFCLLRWSVTQCEYSSSTCTLYYERSPISQSRTLPVKKNPFEGVVTIECVVR